MRKKNKGGSNKSKKPPSAGDMARTASNQCINIVIDSLLTSSITIVEGTRSQDTRILSYSLVRRCGMVTPTCDVCAHVRRT